ncbi:MAG: hypothetical protein M1836_004082 [Candelina mexicana]|nr:MAG: hypothetical protein M1836_004082 [Candelina mexicana]
MTLVNFLLLLALSYSLASHAAPAAPAAAVVYAPKDCCAVLSQNFSSAVFLPDSSQYSSTTSAYWSIQARLTSTCVFRPLRSEDVANAVVELAAHSCQFAIKGGGYTAWAGAANIEMGVTIDLGGISNVQLNKQNNVAFISAGASWNDVYDYLGSQGVAVAAGMSVSSGVGGLILGGGNGFFSAQHGFTCDSVVNYVVVLANGSLVNANRLENPDLYNVLKGGSNNFGVVVRFDITVFEQGDMWGGLVTYPNSTTAQQVNALAAFTDNIVNDPKGSSMSSWTYDGGSGQTNVVNSYVYTEPTAYPPVFQNFTSINPVLANTARTGSLLDFTQELQGSNNTRYVNSLKTNTGFSGSSIVLLSSALSRDLMATLTFANDPAVMSQVVNLSNIAVQTVKNTQGLVWSAHLQPLPRIITEHSITGGGNMLGLDGTQGNLILFILEISWSNSQDDASINNAADALLAEVKAYTKIVEKDNDFIYLNYALHSQKPFEGYGSANLETMKRVSKKYDPDGVWQNLVKGGFKL